MGLFDFLSGKKDSGRDAGNALSLNAGDAALAQGQLGDLLRYQGSDAALDPIQSSRTATDEVQNNAILGQLFGKGGTLSNTVGEEQNLAKRGYSLKPEDYEAYGQGSDQIAREFGAAGGNLAQALSDRGLSGSAGPSAQAFSGLGGNKTEQLGQLQRQIANDRMNMNMQRLGQTRSFLSNMAGQAGQQIQNQYGRQSSSEAQRFGELQAKNAAAQSRLTGMQNQANENLGQRAATEQQQGWASALQGIGNTAQQAGFAAATGGFGGGGGGLGDYFSKGVPSSGVARPEGMSGPTRPNGSY